MRDLTRDDVLLHNTPVSCWVVISEYVYDLTEFLNQHPGGAEIILQFSGGDATSEFLRVHSLSILNSLPSHCRLGRIKGGKLVLEPVTLPEYKDPSNILNLHEFALEAENRMSHQGWIYYSTGSEDEKTLKENTDAIARWWLRPRVLINVKEVSTQTTMLGCSSTSPFYISATALGKLAHPDGEAALTRSCGPSNIIQMLSTIASCSMEDVASQMLPNQNLFYQLYVNSDRGITHKAVLDAMRLGFKAIFITVDAPQLGRREKDMKNKFTLEGSAVQKGKLVDRSKGVANALTSFIDSSLDYDDIKWIQSFCTLPIVLKGVQCGEDAILAARAGVAGIVVSNHGGRQLDSCRAGIDILEEVMLALGMADLTLEVFVDGGFRRGTDIFKALALGATGVGIGRPFLYALAGYGEAGVEHAIQLLQDELALCMRLMGVRRIKDINRRMVCRQNEIVLLRPELVSQL